MLKRPFDPVVLPCVFFVDRVLLPLCEKRERNGLVVKYHVFPHLKHVQASPDFALRGKRIVRPQSHLPDVCAMQFSVCFEVRLTIFNDSTLPFKGSYMLILSFTQSLGQLKFLGMVDT